MDVLTSDKLNNATICYNVSRGHLTTIQCDYPIFYHIEAILYRTFFGCFFDLIEVILLSALWFCNLWIQRDFTEAFLSSVALPLTLSTVLKIATFIFDFLFPRDYAKAWLIYLLYSISVTSTMLTLIQGLPFFLYMAMKVGRTRKQIYGVCTWVPYLLNIFIAFPLAGVFNIFPNAEQRTPALFAILAVIIISYMFMFTFVGMGCMAFTCCTKKKAHMDTLDPVVYDARSRLGWAMLYALFTPVPCIGSLYCFVSYAFFLDKSNYYDVLTNEMATRTWFFFFGPLVLILSFLMLPTYRDTILCGCRKHRLAVRPPVTSQMVLPTAPVQVFKAETSPVVNLTDEKKKDKEAIFVTSCEKKPYPVQNMGPACN